MNLPFLSSSPIVHPGGKFLGAGLHRAFNGAILIGMLQTSWAQAQGPDTLSLHIPPMALVTDSARASRPASHRTVEKGADEPVQVLYCPNPSYPIALGVYGFGGHVSMEFVVDTSGLAEMGDLFVAEATHIGFVPAARRAIGKCRYRPAQKAGRPVRYLVQQRVVFRQQNPDSIR
jgi:Gram-negative bacterial TonB protein C-terminal